MSHEYSENILVQESAGNLQRDELGWDVVFAYNREVLGSTGTLRRSSYKEAVLTRYLEKASSNTCLTRGPGTTHKCCKPPK